MYAIEYFSCRNVIKVSNVEVIFGHIDSHIPAKKIVDLLVQNVHNVSIQGPS